MAFLKKFDIKQICVVSHQEINIFSNFGSRKTKTEKCLVVQRKISDPFIRKHWNQSLVKTARQPLWPGVPWYSQILAHKLTLFKPGVQFITSLHPWIFRTSYGPAMCKEVVGNASPGTKLVKRKPSRLLKPVF